MEALSRDYQPTCQECRGGVIVMSELTPIVRRKLKDGRIIEREGRGFSINELRDCLLSTSPSPRDLSTSRMPSSA